MAEIYSEEWYQEQYQKYINYEQIKAKHGAVAVENKAFTIL